MYLVANNIKAIERKKNAYIVVVENKYNKLGEELYWINKDAFDILVKINGMNTLEDIALAMCKGDISKIKDSEEKLLGFLDQLEMLYGIFIKTIEKTILNSIPILGTGRTQYPSAISIEITHRCNVKCLHCYGEYSSANSSVDNSKKLKKVLRDARKAGTRVVEFTGGEVTCHPKFTEILMEAYDLGYNLVSILSNGLFWNEEHFNLIEKHKRSTVVQIDLHGDNDGYNNWFMGSNISNITKILKNNILRIHKMGILMRVVTMITPKNIDQLYSIAEWVSNNGIETYGLSSITPMGRAALNDKYGLLLKTEADAQKVTEVIIKIKEDFGEKFLYQIKDGDSNLKNCGAFTSNPSITPEGNIKFCAMDDETIINSFGNVFIQNIGEIYTNQYETLNLIRSIPAPMYDSDFCKNCDKKYFCSYCIIRGLTAAKNKGYKGCDWFKKCIPDEFRRLLK